MSEELENQLKGKRVSFLNLGCKVNAYETEAMKQHFQCEGAKIVDFLEKADICIVNTCTVTNIADRKSRQMLHKAKHMNAEAIVVAVGCYVQTAEEELKKDKSIDLLINNDKKKEIVDILNNYLLSLLKRKVRQNIKELDLELLSTSIEKTRAYIKIQEGCNQFCSYCIIPYARGSIRSRKMEDIIEEVKRLVKNGYQEIVLTGIHLSSYGFENRTLKEQQTLQVKDGEALLLTLIRELNQIEGLKRIRLGSLEPRVITEEFVKILKKFRKLCPHFHLSLQSGCNETLKRMNRKYTTNEYARSCELLRKYFQTPSITTDIIVGFPGESEEEFARTKTFLESIGFSKMHIFKYSKRKGTVAENMDNQVLEQIKSERSNTLMQLEEQMRHEYERSHYGIVTEVLFEEAIEIDGETYMTGHTKRYEKIVLKTEENLVNQIIKVKILKHFINDTILSRQI